MSPTSDPADPRPELRVVAPDGADPADADSSAAAPPAPASEAPAPARTRRGGVLTWLLIAAALVFAWLWLTQVEKANGLAARIVSLEQELAAAQAGLVAWEAHHDAVRSGVEGLASQLTDLQALLDRAPAGPDVPPAAAATDEVPSGDASPAAEPAAD